MTPGSILHRSFVNFVCFQGDFLDTYHNLIMKGVMAYRWLNKYCSNAKYIIKVRQTMFDIMMTYIIEMEMEMEMVVYY